MTRVRAILPDQRGAVSVMVALLFPVFLLFCVLAVDVANWFLHKRQLQTQADAAALAGAGAYRFPACDDDLVTAAALRYSGKGDGSVTYNDPGIVNTPQSELHAVINGPDYHGQSTPNEADLAGSPTPCEAKMVDVKMTETNLPWFFGTGIVDHINAQARVQLFQVNEMDGTLPLGVQEAAPRRVRAYVIDEENPTASPLGSVLLSAAGSDDGLLRFDNEAQPLAITVPSTVRRLGVRLALGGVESTTCGEVLVACFDSASTDGLSYIRAWSDEPSVGSGEAPRARSVFLVPRTCRNASFVTSPTTCTIDVKARVKWNPGVAAADLGTRTKLVARFAGAAYPMTYDATTQLWTATDVSVPAGTIGPRPVTIDWEQQVGTVGGETCKTTGGNKCQGTLTENGSTALQRVFWNDAANQSSRGGPVGLLDVQNGSLQQVSDLQRCSSTNTECTYDLIFDVGVKGALKLSEPDDPPVSLRVQGGSQNQTLDCDTGRDFVDEISYGCVTPYRINKGTPCTTTEPTPKSCVPVQTGTTANKPSKGFNTRFLCEPPGNPGSCGGSDNAWDGKPSVCPPAGQYGANNWPAYPEGDPRIVPVFLVPFGTFTASGNELVPILDFASFYVTGWSSKGQGFDNPCIGNGDQFVPGSEEDAGVISGHFIKTVNPNVNGSGTETCDFDDVGRCVATLVK